MTMAAIDSQLAFPAAEPVAAPDDLVIREMRESDSFEDLTDLLHAAYQEHLREGRNYRAATQSVEMTRRRCREGITLLAFLHGQLVGTATMAEKHGRRCVYGGLLQVAVSPDCRALGLGKILLARLEQLAREKGYAFLVCDTAASARKLVAWYLRQGWRKVSCKSHKSTNYYSIVFRKPLDGRPLGLLDDLGFWLNALQCHMFWRADGRLRMPLRLIRRSKKTTPESNETKGKT